MGQSVSIGTAARRDIREKIPPRICYEVHTTAILRCAVKRGHANRRKVSRSEPTPTTYSNSCDERATGRYGNDSTSYTRIGTQSDTYSTEYKWFIKSDDIESISELRAKAMDRT